MLSRWLFFALGCLAGHQGVFAAAAADDLLYARDVRPILSQHCFRCHGPDEKKREGGLRLDLRDAALKAAGSGEVAIVPKQPDHSELLRRVLSDDPDERMPPPATKDTLTAAQADTLRRWIAAGANYTEHWSFAPVGTGKPPAIQQANWVRNPIDAFILAQLEQESVRPSPEADKPTLLRRVYLDLIGLLPSSEEQIEFQSDTRPDAYERVVDRLLKSPHYGERWGRHWLDQARYADSHGYTIDGDREMWPFRDWVIEALNSDQPFNQFTIEQLAGDLLPNPTKKQLAATAFHRNTLINQEGGVNREQFRVESVVDRVNTTGAVWLGMTVLCAQCHTHKFDPITHREYYQLFSFFNQTQDANDKSPTLAVARGELFGNPVTPTTPVQPTAAEIAQARAAWEKTERERLQRALPGSDQPAAKVEWRPAKYSEYDTISGANFRLLPDNSLLSDGKGAVNDTYRIIANTELKQIAAIRLRALTHESLPKQGPGLAPNGNFVLTKMEVRFTDAEQTIVRASADHEQPNYPVTGAIDDSAKSGWAINVGKDSKAKMNADHEAIFVLAKPLDAVDKPCEIRLHHELNEGYLLGRFAIEFSDTAPAISGEKVLWTALKKETANRSAAEKDLVQTAFDLTRAESTAKASKKTKGDSADLMVMRVVDKPRDTYILTKGDFTRPNKEIGVISPGVLAVVSPALPMSGQPRTRLDLARWLVDPKNPLTPRVTMNRVWMRYFGKGLVETEEDFGLQGSLPTHPELLDWLAAEFIRQGWSQKQMHQLIVTSATYRQSSAARDDLRDRDPRNLLLARQERIRLDAEILRDAGLSASGLLDRTVGGPSVHPPQPDGVYAFTQNSKAWQTDNGPSRYRRAMYTHFYRSAPYPLFSTFDSPDFQSVCTRRLRSNTPLQSLMLANDAGFFEMARALAARVLKENGDDKDNDRRLQSLCQIALSRAATAQELAVLKDHLNRRTVDFAKDSAGADKLLSAELKRNMLPAAEKAALVSVARVVLNSDAFICRE